MALVIDTDVASYLYKQDTLAALYRPHLTSPPFVISFMTLAELRHSRARAELGPGAKASTGGLPSAVSGHLRRRRAVRALSPRRQTVRGELAGPSGWRMRGSRRRHPFSMSLSSRTTLGTMPASPGSG